MGRTYVGRIVFAAFCDKLFDIDEKLNIVPQRRCPIRPPMTGKEMAIKTPARLSNSMTASRRRRGRKILDRAPHHFQGSFRSARARHRRSCRCRRSLTIKLC